MTSRAAYFVIIGLILAVAALLRLNDPVPLARLRLLVFDTYQQLEPRAYDATMPVRIVDIDEASLERLGQWPWPRTSVAELVSKLNELGAAVIGFDMVFPETDRLSPGEILKRLPKDVAQQLGDKVIELPSNDQVLAQAIGQAQVVMGFIAVAQDTAGQPPQRAGFAHAGDDPAAFAPRFRGAAVNLPILADKAAGSGALNWLPEYDQIIRRIPLLVRVGDQMHASLAAEALRLAQGAGSYLVKSSGASGETAFGTRTGINHVRIGATIVPTDGGGQMWLRFSPTDSRRFISAQAVLGGAVSRDEIEGRIILIGTSAAGLFDLRTTALGRAVPGVEIHAQAIEQMIAGTHLRRPDYATGVELAFFTVTGAAMVVLLYVSGAIWGALFGLLTVAGVLAQSYLAFAKFGALFDPVYPAIVLIFVYIVGTVYLFLLTERDRNRVRSAFGHYMAPAFVEELARDPSKLKLGGENREVTILFCDVRGFTAISEKLDAEALTQFLNRLLTPLSNSILETRGTIDKYMGDAIMAFWNAPLDDPKHAHNGCRAALRMLRSLDRLNAEWRNEAELRSEPHTPVRIGIGLNSAVCCVGNLGSEHRFDYSVIGDGVNLASRLEGQSKYYGLPVVVGQSTAEGAAHLALLEIDLVNVVGKRQATRVFALLGDETRKRDPKFMELSELQGRMLAAYRDSRFEDARCLLAQCRLAGMPELERLYELYDARIARCIEHPPPADWDGSSASETK